MLWQGCTYRGIASLLFLASTVKATHLTNDRLQKVYDVMQQISTHSWENGTMAQAILEYTYPDRSVFAQDSPFPLPTDLQTGDISQVVDIAQITMENRPATNTSAKMNGSSLLKDSAAGDPASLGVAVLLANASTKDAEVKSVGYGDAATSELNYLLYNVPRLSDGAISHRADQAQLWSDSIYMVPPFLAYYGVLTNNQTIVQEAYTQCSLYRKDLAIDSGLYRHILFGDEIHDPGLWATGNGWAAMGMLRVLATIKQSQFDHAMQQQQVDLQNWVEAILSATNGYIDKSGLLHNYLNDSSTFEDASATALIAAAGLRLSTLGLTNDHVDMATKLLSAASSKVNSTGYLTQVVNPNSFGAQGDASPEGQSFIVMAYAAYNQWNASGRPGSSSGDKDPLGKYSGAIKISTPPIGLVSLAIAALSWSLL